MTQMTTQRILDLMINGDGKTFSGSGDDYGLYGPANAIAAEIDFTAAQRDGAYVAHEEVNESLIKARKQIKNLFGALSVCTSERDTLTERNAFLLASAEAAQANLAACRRELAEARAFISTIIDAPKDYPAEVSE